QVEAARTALGRQHLELVTVVEGERAQDVRLVVDDEYGKLPVIDPHGRLPNQPPPAALSSDGAAAASSGRAVRNVAPVPGALSTSMRPPCAVTTPWLIASPRPVPLPTSLVVKNGSKMRSATSRGIPGPSSRMVTVTVSASASAVVATHILPVSVMASHAL